MHYVSTYWVHAFKVPQKLHLNKFKDHPLVLQLTVDLHVHVKDYVLSLAAKAENLSEALELVRSTCGFCAQCECICTHLLPLIWGSTNWVHFSCY